MVPFWKVKREISRFFSSLSGVPEDVLTWLFGARYYDVLIKHKSTSYAGTQTNSPRHAVYLIFPSLGLLPSHETSLRYLNDKGVATTLVSNLPLSGKDRERALSLCRTYIERPNFGYDFGGYRDGVLSLEDQFCEMDQLILLNDSAWFPITDATDWLDDIDALNVDFGAAASNYGLPRPDPEDYTKMVFNYRTDHANFHYCSFALSFGKRMLNDPGFERFWQSFPLSNKKKRTVRRGEIGLTKWALGNGFSHGSTLDIANMGRHLKQLDEKRLREIADMLIVMDDRRMRDVQSVVAPGLKSMTKHDIISYILTTAARKGVSYATAEYNIFERGFPFLKKSPVSLEKDTSDKTMKIIEKLDTPAAGEAMSEARHIRESRFPEA